MKIKLSIFILSILFLSACSLNKKASLPINNSVNPPSPTISDDKMLEDLNSDPDFKIDSSTNQLNSELQ